MKNENKNRQISSILKTDKFLRYIDREEFSIYKRSLLQRSYDKGRKAPRDQRSRGLRGGRVHLFYPQFLVNKTLSFSSINREARAIEDRAGNFMNLIFRVDYIPVI